MDNATDTRHNSIVDSDGHEIGQAGILWNALFSRPNVNILTPPLIISMICFAIATMFAGMELWRTTRNTKLRQTQQLHNIQRIRAGVNGGAWPPSDIEQHPNSFRAAAMQQQVQQAGGSVGIRNATVSSGGRIMRGRGNRRDDSPTGVRDSSPNYIGTPTSSLGTPNSSKKTSGEVTRRAFYKWIFLAVVCRTIMLPFLACYYYENEPQPNIDKQTGLCLSSSSPAGCIVSRTLPDFAYASAYITLVIFFAQATLIASGGVPSITNSAIQAIQSGNIRNGGSPVVKRWFDMERWFTHVDTISNINYTMFIIYGSLLFITSVIPILPFAVFQCIVWAFLCVIYFVLLILLSYFAPMLYPLVKENLDKTPVGRSLSRRLFSMHILCAVVFFTRALFFGWHDWIVWSTTFRHHKYTDQDSITSVIFGHKILVMIFGENSFWVSHFGKDVLESLSLEFVPTIMILTLMYQQTPKIIQSPGARSEGTGNEDTSIGGAGAGGGVGGISANVGMLMDSTGNAFQGNNAPTRSNNTSQNVSTLGFSRSHSTGGGAHLHPQKPQPSQMRQVPSSGKNEASPLLVTNGSGGSYGTGVGGSGGGE